MVAVDAAAMLTRTIAALDVTNLVRKSFFIYIFLLVDNVRHLYHRTVPASLKFHSRDYEIKFSNYSLSQKWWQ